MKTSNYEAATDRYNKMTYRRCGRSGIRLPEVSLGLWHNFGSIDNYDNYSAIALEAFDAGITHFDLANNYGPEPGSAETNFGRIMRESLGRYRDEMIISTKAGYLMWDGPYGEWGRKEKMEEWKEFWGDDFEGRQCTVDDYNGFDKIYNSLLESRQILNADDLFTLRRVSKMMYRIEKLILKTDDKSILMAKNLQDIVNKTMESSLLRKKDMGEQAAFRLDDMVKALERRNVKFFTLKEVQEKLALFHPAHLHPLDLADQALEKIMNCVVGNSGLADYAVIPDEFQPDAFDGNA